MSNDFLPVGLIQTFVAFIEAPNITEAAENLGMSQPAVSVHLRKLEEYLPHPVFHMQGKRKVPSAYGRALYESLAPVFKQLGKEVEGVNLRFSVPARQSLDIGLEDMALTQFFGPSSTARQLRFQQACREKLLVDITEGRLLFALTSQELKADGIVFKKMSSFPWQLRTHRQWIHQKNWMNSQSWLTETPFLCSTEGLEKLNTWQKKQGNQEEEPHSLLQASSYLAIQQMVSLGLGYAIVPSWLTGSLSQVACHDIEEKVIAGQTLFTCCRKENQDHPALVDFLNNLDMIDNNISGHNRFTTI